MSTVTRVSDPLAELIHAAVAAAVREYVEHPEVRLYDVAQVAERLACSPSKAKALLATGQLPSVVVGERGRRVRSDVLERYIRSLGGDES